MGALRKQGHKIVGEKSPLTGLFWRFARCESSGYVTLPKSLTCRYPSSLLWEDSHEPSRFGSR